MRSDAVSASPVPYDIARAASECDFGVCHAGHGTTCELLLKGKPLLLLPMQLEQYLTARRVSEAEAGIFVDQENPEQGFCETTVGQLVDSSKLAKGAQDFAQRYENVNSLSTVCRIADGCETMAQRARSSGAG